MALPVLDFPTFDLKLPSTGKKIKYRPFLVKEEKVLLIAIESGEESDIVQAVQEILKACILTEKVDILNLASFDIEYIFLKIRSKSVGEIVELSYQHVDGKNKDGKDCDHVQEVEVNIDAVEVNTSKGHSRKIMITDNIGVKFRYPNFDMISENKEIEDEVERTFQIIYNCVDVIWEGDEVHDEFTEAELKAFVESMSKDQFEKLSGFFGTMPTLSTTIEYTCGGCGQEEKIEVSGLADFFT